MTQPLVTVSIITYNRSKFLSRMIQSAINEIKLSQLEKDVNIVINDNNSSDDTEYLVRTFISDNHEINIAYYKNKINIGAIKNVTKALSNSTGKYWMLFGDDDEVAENGLINIVNILQKYPDKPAFLFNNLQGDYIKQGEIKSIKLDDAVQKYFYLFGNFGIFAINTNLAKESLNNYHDLIISTCWPQTEIGYRVMISSGNTEPLVTAGIISSNSPNHAENSSYNSWYIFETVYYALIRVGLNIDYTYKNGFTSLALKGIPLSKGYKLFKYLFLYSTFADTNSEIKKAQKLASNAYSTLKGFQKLRTLLSLAILYLPKIVKNGVLIFLLILMRPLSFKKRFRYFSNSYKKYVLKKDYSNHTSMYG